MNRMITLTPEMISDALGLAAIGVTMGAVLWLPALLSA